MNWVFVARDTYELKYGLRVAAEGNLTGPFDCTRQDRRLTFGGWEGFVAVQQGDFWALYFDRDGDRLKGMMAEGTTIVEVALLRREIRTPPLYGAMKGEGGGERKTESGSHPAEADLPPSPDVD